jgi:hypothetical protein
MDKVQKINEKVMIFGIIIGFALGIYLGIRHDEPNFWFILVQWIFFTSFIMTFISALGGFYANSRDDSVEFSMLSVIKVFALDTAVVAVSVSFGFVFCSIAIGNFSTAN